MAKRFDTPRDASRRLDRTICFYKQVPYYVRFDANDHMGVTVILYNVPKDDFDPGVRVKYTEDAFSYEAPLLGFLNTGACAYYIERETMRNQRYGVPLDNLKYEGGKLPLGLARVKGMSDMLLNIYPSVSECIAHCKKGDDYSMAFHKDYCIQGSRLGVIYRDLHLGKMVERDGAYVMEFDYNLKKLSFFQRSFNSLFGNEFPKG
jgi:hypothetical protein